MSRRMLLVASVLALLVALPCPAPSCSLCSTNLQQIPTFRQEAAQPSARMILIGTLQNGRVSPPATDLHVTQVLRPDPALGGKKIVELPRYIPTDEKNPARYLIFLDVLEKDKLDPYRGVPLKTAEAADYVKKALTLDPKDRVGNLQFFFRYLENPDKEVAADAYLEFAKATDQEIGKVGPKLSAEKLRVWLRDPQTPDSRLGLYAFLLGLSGGDQDATYFQTLLKSPTERTNAAFDGILGALIHLRPKEGWETVQAILHDGRRPLLQRLAVVRTLRFYHGWQPDKSKAQILRAAAVMLEQGQLADVAVEDLRRWQLWDLTGDVLALYGKKGYDAPVVQRALVRYALSCPETPARRFLDDLRRKDPEVVKEVEESLQFEKK
jgi:hypothetical protein